MLDRSVRVFPIRQTFIMGGFRFHSSNNKPTRRLSSSFLWNSKFQWVSTCIYENGIRHGNSLVINQTEWKFIYVITSTACCLSCFVSFSLMPFTVVCQECLQRLSHTHITPSALTLLEDVFEIWNELTTRGMKTFVMLIRVKMTRNAVWRGGKKKSSCRREWSVMKVWCCFVFLPKSSRCINIHIVDTHN